MVSMSSRRIPRPAIDGQGKWLARAAAAAAMISILIAGPQAPAHPLYGFALNVIPIAIGLLSVSSVAYKMSSLGRGEELLDRWTAVLSGSRDRRRQVAVPEPVGISKVTSSFRAAKEIRNIGESFSQLSRRSVCACHTRRPAGGKMQSPGLSFPVYTAGTDHRSPLHEDAISCLPCAVHTATVGPRRPRMNIRSR